MLKIKNFIDRQFDVLERKDLKSKENQNAIYKAIRLSDKKIFTYLDELVDYNCILGKIDEGQDAEVNVWVSIYGFEENCVHVKLCGGVDTTDGMWRLCWHEELVEINELESEAFAIAESMVCDYESLEKVIKECRFKEKNNIFE